MIYLAECFCACLQLCYHLFMTMFFLSASQNDLKCHVLELNCWVFFHIICLFTDSQKPTVHAPLPPPRTSLQQCPSAVRGGLKFLKTHAKYRGFKFYYYHICMGHVLATQCIAFMYCMINYICI